MSETKDIELLTDIARLLKKHGPEPFEQLAQKFKEGCLVEDLLSILDTSARTGRLSRARLGEKRPPAKRKDGITELFQHVEKDEPEKAIILKQLYHSLVGKMILPTLRDIRHFVEDNGLQPVKATSRDKAILPLLRDLASVPSDKISYMVSSVPCSEVEGGRTLEGWAGIILGSRNKDTDK